MGLSLAVAVCEYCPVKWRRAIKRANIVFLSFYLGLLLLWLIRPDHLFLGDQEHIRRFITDRMDIVFEYGRACELFHGVSHTSVFLALMIAYWSIFPGKGLLENGLFIFLNFLTLFTTTRRGALIASVIGFLFSIRLSGRRGISTTLLLAIILATLTLFMFYSGVARHFIREDWHLIAQGRIEKAKKLGGSIPLRVSTYKEFSKRIMSNPFMPRGLGRKLIEEHWKGLVEKAGLQHGHNTMLNQAFYLGIQGALSLLIIIGGQFFLVLRALRMGTSGQDQQLMMVALVFMVIFWGINLFSDAFRHSSANLYWLITGLATGRAMYLTKVAPVIQQTNRGLSAQKVPQRTDQDQRA